MADTETTPDEIDEIINPAPVDATTVTDEADNVTMTRAELARLQQAADEADALRADVDGLRQQVYASQQPQPQQQQTHQGLTGEALFADPAAAIRGEITNAVTPMAQQFASTLASVRVENFTDKKSTDPLYSGVNPIFTKKLKGMRQDFLGSLPAENLTATLNEAWNASVGEYVISERGKRKPARAANLGGGDAGGAGAPKSLRDIDQGAFQMAVNAGWTQEQMDDLAKELNEGTNE